MGNILIRVLAVLLCLAARPAAGQVIGTPVLASAPNFRDIAGIAAAYGGTGFVNVTSQFGLMRTGVFYRSDALNGLSDTDWRTISSLGIGRDIDLRTPSEIASAPDLVPGGAFYTNVNIYGSSSPPSFPSFASSLSESLGYFENLYRGFVTDPTERANFRTVLLTLAHDPFPDVYHCSGGKDRTGWTSAILESIAGVPSATIMRDYLATDSYTAATIEASRAAILAEQPGANAATITVLLGVVPGYLEAALDQVNQSYGSMYGYLIQGLGLTLEDIYVLRAKMVSYPVLPGQGGLAGNAASGAALLNGLQQSALSGRYTAYNFYLQSSVDLGGLGGVPGQVGGQVHADTASALLRQPGWVDEALRPYGESRDLAAGQARFWLAGLGGAFWTQGGTETASSREQKAGSMVGVTYRAGERAGGHAGLGALWGAVGSAGATATTQTVFATLGGRFGFLGLDSGPYLAARALAGFVDVQSDRPLGGGLGSASGRTTGGLASGLAALGHVFARDGLTVTPQVGVRVTGETLAGFTESGSELALSVHGRDNAMASLVADLDAALDRWGGQAWAVSPALTLGYERLLGDPQVTSLGTCSGQAVSQRSAFGSHDLFKAGLGLAAAYKSLTLRVRADGVLGDGGRSVGVGGQLSFGYTF
ncbi:MAG: tyrosine-protein phosphatase [Solidesulfovibrio sp. DCME]|uniref:tyrosine-protein phosphatase n=1 Tax=Solidesulfovibrio sp. DCME TaxID=3447380 RepID=UPI003D0D7582